MRTEAGDVQGAMQGDVYRYLGVPYARATERFVPAEEVEPWDGVLTTNSYGATSPQGSMLGMSASEDDDTADNNRQNLNIWTPGINDGERRPVMVWLHGGGFSTGSANERNYDGANLSASGDVVVVGVNHRLNVFGHLDLSAYGEKYADSGNVGLTDIIAALEWIQENIDYFGGDPSNVTLFGQSGGGAKQLALMSAPSAKGLFGKAIVQSGATETMGVTFATKEQSQSLTEHLLDNLNITAENIDDLQTVSVSDLQDAATAALQTTADEYRIPAPLGDGYQMEWGPVVDGDFLPTNPVTDDSFAAAGEDVTLLIGSNLNEWTGMSAPTDVPQDNADAIAAAVEEAYPNVGGLEASRVDTLIRLPMLKIMSHKADQGGADVYAYVFTHSNGVMGSYHGAEIPYVFDNVSGDALADHISQAWVSFARTGVPAADGLPEWEPYTRESGTTMLLDDDSELVHHHDQALMSLLAPDYQY
ncbi:carboxylesterase [Bifidobacterium lemurum]|uniref:Carboxylic ester hydrolase n=1 Tax=Bifidobacterium lemurum TaxID=1603886 RepID=A0A261FWL7_9BIFI|nr:carboxylesterase family protein [Bifidobacterium lemurum]OZG63333.1 carboxylesterase [Bifidobacterium lemurum]